MTINVKTPGISKLSRGKKSFTVKVGALSSTYVTGYQVRCSLSSSMTSPKTFTIGSKPATTKKTVKKLKAKKTYYVQVRAFKKIGTKTYYGPGGAKKTV